MKKKNFQVAIMHGHCKDYLEIKEYIRECKFSARILIEEYNILSANYLLILIVILEIELNMKALCYQSFMEKN